MAEIEKLSDLDSDVTVYKISGELLGAKLLTLTERFFANNPIPLVLFDVTQASVGNITVEDF